MIEHRDTRASERVSVVGPDAGVAEVSLRASRDNERSVILKDSAGLPLAGARVGWYANPWGGNWALTDADGVAQVLTLPSIGKPFMMMTHLDCHPQRVDDLPRTGRLTNKAVRLSILRIDCAEGPRDVPITADVWEMEKDGVERKVADDVCSVPQGGSLEFRNLRPGTYRVATARQDVPNATYSVEVDLVEGQVAEVAGVFRE